MGHLYPDNISKIMVELAAKPKGTTVHEVVTYLGHNRIPVHCAEGDYRDKTMREISVLQVLRFHVWKKQVVIVKGANRAMRGAWAMWVNDEFDGNCWTPDSRDILACMIFYRTPFRFKRGAVVHPDHIES